MIKNRLTSGSYRSVSLAVTFEIALRNLVGRSNRLGRIEESTS